MNHKPMLEDIDGGVGGQDRAPIKGAEPTSITLPAELIRDLLVAREEMVSAYGRVREQAVHNLRALLRKVDDEARGQGLVVDL